MARRYRVNVGGQAGSGTAFVKSLTDALGFTDTPTVTLTGGVSPTLLSRVSNVGTTSTGRVAVRTTSATSVRLKVGTDAAVTQGVVYGPAVTPDANGNCHATVTGLGSGSWFYYRVLMTNAQGAEFADAHATVGKLRTLTPAGTPCNLNIDFGSCQNTRNPAVFATIAARNDDYFFHIGDMVSDPAASNYADLTGTGIANFRTQFTAVLNAANAQTLMSTRPTVYTPSDHDAMANNSNAGVDATAWANWNTVYRDYFAPTSVLASGTATGCHRTWQDGRYVFVVLDRRSFATIPSATDNATKTCLGATQKQWFKDTITAAPADSMMLVTLVDPWIGTTAAGDDAWLGYNTERQELATFIAASGKKVVGLAGDMHALAAEDGSGSPGGVAVFHGAPFYQTASQKGGPYDVGPYPATGTALVQQYGRIVLTDDGYTITAAFTGYSSDNTARVTQTVTKDTTPAMPVGNLAGDTVAPNGWTQVLAENWNTDVALGGFATNGVMASTEYATTGWTVYGKGVARTATTEDVWSNNRTSFYNGGEGIKVSGGVLSVRCYTDASGYHRTDTLRAPIGKGRQQTYGCYEIAYRLPAALTGYKQAWLLWPTSNLGADGELDFPETDFNAAATIRGFVHEIEPPGLHVNNAYSVNSNVILAGTGWHVARMKWGPSQVEFWLDGTRLGAAAYTNTTHIPDVNMDWKIQTEGNLSGTTPKIIAGAAENTGIDPATDGFVEIAYAACWTRNP